MTQQAGNSAEANAEAKRSEAEAEADAIRLINEQSSQSPLYGDLVARGSGTESCRRPCWAKARLSLLVGPCVGLIADAGADRE